MKVSRKYLLYILVLAVLVSAVAVVGSVYAKYVGDISGTGEITLTPPELIAVVDGPADDGAGAYSIANSSFSTMPGFIRCAVVVNWVDGDGNIWAVPPIEGIDYEVDYKVPDTDPGFTYLGGYYYYNTPVDPSSSVTVSVYQLKEKVGFKLHVQILTESIQTVPASYVGIAWGVKYVDGTWQTVSP